MIVCGTIDETTYIVLEEVNIPMWDGSIFNINDCFDIVNPSEYPTSRYFLIYKKNILVAQITYRDFILYVEDKVRKLTEDEKVIKDIIE